MNKNNLFGIGILLAVLLIFTAPAMARTDDATFYFVPNEVSVVPGEAVTVCLYVDAPVNQTCSFVANVIHDQGVVECLGVTEDPAVTDWMAWTFWGVYPTDDGREYIYFDSLDFFGQGPGHLHCGDMVLRGVNPGVTIMYIGESEVPDGNNRSLIGDMLGDPKDWTTETLTFTCVGPAETFTKPLVADWNLVSLPLTADDMTAGSVLASISGSYDSVMRYDSSAHSFVAVEDTDTMENGVGYFVHVTTADVTWSYDGQPCNSISASLSTGLNCVGWTNTSADLPGALSSIDSSYRYVARWNAGTQNYEVYLSGAPAVFNDFATMDIGEGYFIAATADCTLNP
jgi:hypothetical protein